MLNSIHEDHRAFQLEQNSVRSDPEAVLVLTRGEFLDITGQGMLQGVEPLADVPSNPFRQGSQLLTGLLADEEAVTHTGIGFGFAVRHQAPEQIINPLGLALRMTTPRALQRGRPGSDERGGGNDAPWESPENEISQ